MGAIARVFDVAETVSPKPGHGSLKLLEPLFNVIGEEGIVPEGGGGGEGIVPEGGGAGGDGSATAAKGYFDAWNRRDMADAASLFTEDVVQVKLVAVLWEGGERAIAIPKAQSLGVQPSRGCDRAGVRRRGARLPQAGPRRP